MTSSHSRSCVIFSHVPNRLEWQHFSTIEITEKMNVCFCVSRSCTFLLCHIHIYQDTLAPYLYVYGPTWVSCGLPPPRIMSSLVTLKKKNSMYTGGGGLFHDSNTRLPSTRTISCWCIRYRRKMIRHTQKKNRPTTSASWQVWWDSPCSKAKLQQWWELPGDFYQVNSR